VFTVLEFARLERARFKTPDDFLYLVCAFERLNGVVDLTHD
jgi:hypothetical protein